MRVVTTVRGRASTVLGGKPMVPRGGVSETVRRGLTPSHDVWCRAGPLWN